jgi:hypothetical protein
MSTHLSELSMEQIQRLRTRIQANHIRTKLLARNGSKYFRAALAALSDEELVAQQQEHHEASVQFAASMAERVERLKSEGRLPTFETFQRVLKKAVAEVDGKSPRSN